MSQIFQSSHDHDPLFDLVLLIIQWPSTSI